MVGPVWRRQAWLAAGAASVLLLLPAFYNGFPITYFDTGGYFERWLDLTVTMGRSLAYGLFLGVTAGGLSAQGGSLWGTIAVQAGLTAWLLSLTLRCLLPPGRPLTLVLMVAVLVLATGLPWYTAQVMPDFLEPLLVLAMFLLAFHSPSLNGAERTGLVAVVALAVACHMAFLALALGLLGVIGLIGLGSRWWPALGRPGLGRPMLAVAAGVAALLSVNAGLAGYSGFTPGGESFVFGRMLDKGIVQRFLDEHCPSPAFRLCAYRDRMPTNTNDFIWGDHSPFIEIGGWQQGEPELARIAHESLLDYPLTVFRAALASIWEQLLEVEVGSGLDDWHGHTMAVFRDRLPGHNPAYQASIQQNDEMGFDVLNSYQYPLALASMVLLLASLPWLIRRRQPHAATLAGFVLIALVGNAFICGVFSSPGDRYGNRLVWLATFALMIIAARQAAPAAKPAASV